MTPCVSGQPVRHAIYIPLLHNATPPTRMILTVVLAVVAYVPMRNLQWTWSIRTCASSATSCSIYGTAAGKSSSLLIRLLLLRCMLISMSMRLCLQPRRFLRKLLRKPARPHLPQRRAAHLCLRHRKPRDRRTNLTLSVYRIVSHLTYNHATARLPTAERHGAL